MVRLRKQPNTKNVCIMLEFYKSVWFDCSNLSLLEMAQKCKKSSIFAIQWLRPILLWLKADCRCQSTLPLFAGAATINCVNSDKPYDVRPWMPPGRWSRLSLPVAWTGATRCTTASPTSWCDVCSRCRTLRPGWSLARDVATTSHRCFASCTGFRCGSALTTRSPRSFIGLCSATFRATWLTTADSSPTPVSDDCVLSTLEHWSSVAHKALLARTFAVAAPRLWNSLPSDIRQPDMSYGLFRLSLKTFLFGQ